MREEQAELKAAVPAVYDGLREKLLQREIFDQGRRLDGRRFDEIRAITSEVGVLPRTHGSALFTRGETQALVTVTLGTSEDSQIIDTVQEAEYRKRFMLHYNFPPFSVGEVKFLRGPGRREIGHGALAERSLREMLPPEEAFPYTIRIVSDILESNGSSSMASVCGGTLALMDAGVPIKSPVAGVAMGLVMEGDRYAGPDRHRRRGGPLRRHGLQGRRHAHGITALQMDIKVDGLAPQLMAGALEQARVGRMHILDRMLEALAQPRTEISPYAPRILTIRVPVDKIRDIIGPGGKMIRSIVERTGCKIDIEDDGRVVDRVGRRGGRAQGRSRSSRSSPRQPSSTRRYLGKVVRVVEFGAFVEILPGTDGLLHVSEMAHHRVNDVHDEVKEGDQVLVKVVSIDPSGKIRLSRKALLEAAEGAAVAAGGGDAGGHSHERSHSGHGGGGGRDRDRDRDRRGGGGQGRGGGHGRGGEHGRGGDRR